MFMQAMLRAYCAGCLHCRFWHQTACLQDPEIELSAICQDSCRPCFTVYLLSLSRKIFRPASACSAGLFFACKSNLIYTFVASTRLFSGSSWRRHEIGAEYKDAVCSSVNRRSCRGDPDVDICLWSQATWAALLKTTTPTPRY
jgi:hypothetical protein